MCHTAISMIPPIYEPYLFQFGQCEGYCSICYIHEPIFYFATLSVRPFMRPSVRPSHPSIHPSVCLSDCLFSCLSVCLSLCLSVPLSLYPSVTYLFVILYFCQPAKACVPVFFFVCVWVSIQFNTIDVTKTFRGNNYIFWSSKGYYSECCFRLVEDGVVTSH